MEDDSTTMNMAWTTHESCLSKRDIGWPDPVSFWRGVNYGAVFNGVGIDESRELSVLRKSYCFSYRMTYRYINNMLSTFRLSPEAPSQQKFMANSSITQISTEVGINGAEKAAWKSTQRSIRGH
ncbi:hypothetical protein PMIN06_007266 [Paraphaeosphaeria minitans]